MRIFAILLATALLYSAPARAEILTFNFTGVWNTLRAEVNGKSRLVASSEIIPGGVRIGDTFHGTFNLDTQLIPTIGSTYVSYWPESPWSYNEQPGPKASLNLSSGTSFSSSGYFSNAYVSTDSYYVVLSNWMPSFEMSATFYDFSKPSQGSALPTDFTADTYSAVLSTRYRGNSGSLSMEGMLTSFEKVSPVPEPGTYAMFIAGLAMMGAVARKRRQHSAN